MKLSLIFELLMIFVLLAFAASKNINKNRNNIKGLRNKEDDNIKIEDNSLNRYCKCSESLCNCCRDFSVPVVNLNGPGCASLRYINGDKMSISLSFGKKVITNKTVASRKPSPVCMPLPGGISKFCGRVYNIAKAGEDFRACLGLELQSKSTVEAAVRVSCFKFGPKGVTSEPADPLPLVPQDETETEDDDDDDEEEDDFGLDADDDDEDDVDEEEDDDDDDDGEIDAVNDVDSADYTGFSLLGEDLLGGLFGSSDGKKPNKNRNKQAQPTSSSTTTRRPRPNRRTTRRPNTRTTPRPITRSTTVKVRPINRRPTKRPSNRRPTRRPTTSSAESFPISNVSEMSSGLTSASTESHLLSQSTMVEMQKIPESSEITDSNEKIVSGNNKIPSISATTPVTATSFEDSGLEMSLAHITGQLSVMPATQIIPTLSKDSETKSSEEQISYEKVQTITPKPHSTIPYATVVDDDDANEETVQIVQSLDSQSEEHESDKAVTVDESRAHKHDYHYEDLVMPRKKRRGEQFELEDLDVLDLTKIGESVGHQLGIFGRHKRQNQNKHKKHRNDNTDYDIVSGLDAINESLGLPDIEVARRRTNRRQNKMMRDWSRK
ncbi:eisosome protein SEG2 [Pieris rapae]|uniref:eisosome protein SEG2 n=1 Tax=Pieris rapae TaxID=64459 RepID=UPI001E27D9FD|nr:eisosome protein SEG2 [Pieris rapae]